MALFGSATVVAVNQAQPGIVAAEEQFLAGGACQIICSIYDTAGNPLAPSKLTWRMDDLQSQKNIVPPTNIPAPQTINTVTITAAQNRMVSLTDPNEERRVLFQITDSSGAIYQADARYVLNQVQSVLQLPQGKGPL